MTNTASTDKLSILNPVNKYLPFLVLVILFFLSIIVAYLNSHLTVLAAGLLISFLVFFYLKSMQHMTTTVRNIREKHRHLYETIDQGVIYQAADGRITSANPAAEKILGLTFDQMQGKTSMDPRWQMIEEDGTPVPGEEHPAMIALRTGQTVGPLIRGVFHPEINKHFWLNITAIPLYQFGKAEPFQVNTVFEDITARRQAKEEIRKLNEDLELRVEERTTALKESEEQLKKVTDNVTDAVGMCDLEGNFTYLSPQSHRILGYSSEELLGKPIFTIVYKEDLPAMVQQFNDSLRTKKPSSAEYRIATKDGSLVWVETHGNLLYDNGQVSGAVFVTRDISARKLAEEELRRQGRRTEALLTIGSRLNAELKLDKVLEAICEETCSALRVKIAAYLSYNVTNQRFDLTSSSGLPEELARVFTGLSREGYDDITGKLGKAGAIPDLAAMPELPYVQLLLRHGIKSFVYAVIERDGLPIGVVFAGDNEEEVDLPDDAVELLSGLANQAASAVTNARLLHETLTSLQQVQALRNIDMAITGSFDLRVTFQVILDEVTGMLKTDAAAILLLDPYSGTLRYEQWRGFNSKDLKSITLPQGKGYGGRAAADRQMIQIADLSKVEPDPVQGALLAKEGFAAYFAVPLITKGTVKGVLEVYHREPVEANSNWLSYLETLAGQTAIAVDNSELLSRLESSSVDLLQAYDATIEGWAHALDLKDEETEEHSQRVTEMTIAMARKMNIKDMNLVHVRRGALLHDIGKMGIPDSILLKPGKLTDEDWVIMHMHPVYAYEMLAPVDYLRPALDIPYCHHEKWDGSGYPRGLKGEEIPLPARIFAVVDVYDALTSDRPYRKAWSEEKTLALIKEDSGKHFDPKVVGVFLQELVSEHNNISLPV